MREGQTHMSIFSVTFIGFMAILVGLYFLLPSKYQWVILLAASMVFYLAGGWHGIFYILVTIISQYLLALTLEHKNDEMAAELALDSLDFKQKKQIKLKYASKKKRYILLSVLINLGILCIFKFSNLAIESLNRFLGTQVGSLGLLAPLGLSYYTFKSIGYVIDVHRGRIKAQRNIFKLALYISYFPTLIQGPIDRYEDLADQLYAEHTFDYQRLAFGVQRMLWGYIKKLVIAERIAVIVYATTGAYAENGYVGFTVFLGMTIFAFQLYADFSGGMDIVMGLSEIFGIFPTENFRRPFFATSYGEFWQRWHITLGAWMRTYVFYPLSLSPAFNRLGKTCRKVFGDKYGKLIPPSLTTFITFFLIGMWHGAGWRYVLYSLYQALLVSTGTLLVDVYDKGKALFRINEPSKIWHVFQMLRTFFLVTATRYLTLAKDLSDIKGLLKATFTCFNPWVFFDGSLYTLGLDRQNFTLMLLSIVGLLIVDYIQEKGIHIRQTIAEQNIVIRWCVYYAAIIILVVFGMYGPGFDAASFIYENF